MRKRKGQEERREGSREFIQTSQGMFETRRVEKDAFREGKRGEEQTGKKEGGMLAEMEKEVMIVSFLCCEPELTWLEVRQ